MRHRRLQRILPITIVTAAIIGSVVAYVIGMSVLQTSKSRHIAFVDLLASRSIEVLIVGWCLWVGVSIGSFLNVVAWRMPRGRSINGRSICPRCQVQLRARDNVPVLGWLALNGRCRTCRLPISYRYPIVESVVGLSIAAIAVGELFLDSLPQSQTRLYRGSFVNLTIEFSGIATLVYHICAISVSWAIGLIRMDGNRLPSKLVKFAAFALIAPLLCYPRLMIVPWQLAVASDWSPDGRHLDAIVWIITALAMAIFLARSMSPSLCPTADPKLNPLGDGTNRLVDLIAVLAVPAVVVGWQAALAVAVVATILAILIGKIMPQADGLGRLAICTPVALVIQIMLWNWSQRFDYWPSIGVPPAVFLAWGAAGMMLPLWLRDRQIPNSKNRIRAAD